MTGGAIPVFPCPSWRQTLSPEGPFRVTSRPWGEAVNGSAAEGEAERPCGNADVRARTSGVGGLPAVAGITSKRGFLARALNRSAIGFGHCIEDR